MKIHRSDQQPLGRYAIGGKVSYVGGKHGWWERTIFARSDTDVPFTITPKYAGCPDKLAKDVYGKELLMWFILQYNNIIDVNTEFVTGAEIMLPTVGRVFTELLSSNK